MNPILKAALCVAALPLTLLVTGNKSEAQTSELPVPNLAPGQVVEMIAPPATITSTVHYQALIGLTCSSPSQICSGNFPPPGHNRQLNVTRVTCVVGTSNGHSILYGLIALYKPTGVL